MGIYLEDKELDSVLENYFNKEQIIQEGLFNIIKRLNDKQLEKEQKRKDDNVAKEMGLTSEQYQKYKNYKFDKEDAEYEMNQVEICVNLIKKIIPKIKTTQEFKQKCIKSSEEFNNNWLDETEKPLKIGYIPKLVVDNQGDYIEIINESQEINIVYSWILEDIVKFLKSEYKDEYDHKYIDFDYGDGDEGCIYSYITKAYILNKIKNS